MTINVMLPCDISDRDFKLLGPETIEWIMEEILTHIPTDGQQREDIYFSIFGITGEEEDDHDYMRKVEAIDRVYNQINNHSGILNRFIPDTARSNTNIICKQSGILVCF